MKEIIIVMIMQMSIGILLRANIEIMITAFFGWCILAVGVSLGRWCEYKYPTRPKGIASDVKVYNWCLSDKEIATEYKESSRYRQQ